MEWTMSAERLAERLAGAGAGVPPGNPPHGVSATLTDADDLAAAIAVAWLALLRRHVLALEHEIGGGGYWSDVAEHARRLSEDAAHLAAFAAEVEAS